jgi:hypothetical protein
MSVYENMVRKRFIGRLLESGFSWGETALRMDMSERRVQQIAQELQGQGLIQELAPKKRGRKSAQEMGAKTPSKNGGQKTGVSCAHVTSTLAAPTGLGKITKHPRSPTLPVGGRPRKKRVEIQSAD